MKKLLAFAVIALASGAAGALAQTPGTPTPGPNPALTAKPAAGAGIDASVDAQANLAIDPAKPFGSLDVAAAGTSPDMIAAWSVKLNDSQKADLKTRCDKISADKGATYPASAMSFCQSFAAVTSGPSPANANQPQLR